MRISKVLIGLSLMLIMASAATADSIQLSTSAAFRSNGSLIDSGSGTATSGTSLSDATVPSNLGGGPPPVFGSGFAAGSANDQGVSAATASAIFYGQTADNLLEAYATIARTATNAGPSAQAYAFDFTISAPTLLAHVYDGIDLTEDGVPTLTYEVEVRSGSTTLWSSSATLIAGRTDQGLVYDLKEEGVDLGGTLISPDFGQIGFAFDAYQGRVDLGIIAAGASVSVETILRVSVSGRGTELGGIASIGDPNDLSGAGGVAGSIVPAVAVVPEPATLALMAIGMPGVIGFIAARRRR